MTRIVIDYETDPDFSLLDLDNPDQRYVSLCTTLYNDKDERIGSLSNSVFYEAADDWETGTFNTVDEIPARCPHLREVATNLIMESIVANEDKTTVTLDERELSAVLAALRYWQWQRSDIIHSLNTRGGAILQIEDNDGEVEPLTDSELDALCERINTGG